MGTNGFDPIIFLKSHIALLTILEDAKKEVGRVKGIPLMAAKALGRTITTELEKSREVMRANKMWVQEKPIRERCYQYSLFGRRDEYEISQVDLNLHVGMAMREIDRAFGVEYE